MKKITTTRTQYLDKCPICKKTITGGSEGHVNYNLKIHLDAKHNKNAKDVQSVPGGKNET